MGKKIVVVGGGSAGWLTALYLKKLYNSFDIYLVESKEIGILGAGEGSVPTLLHFLNSIDISLSNVVKNCDATIKNAIKFTNWNNDNKFYYHGFGINSNLSMGAGASVTEATKPLAVASIFKNDNLGDVDFIEKISEINKVPYTYKDKNTKTFENNNQALGSHSIHFNAFKFANMLKEIGIERGINVLEKTIIDVSLKEKQNIDEIFFDDGTSISPDFVFDCSGFSRLLIGKKLKATWKSYKDFLPIDSAIPFFIEMSEEIPPYTEAIAMKYGWMWKIPLQNRFGCGYVYDSSLISEKDAVKEIEEFLGYEPTYPRKDKGGFSFDAGCYENTWIGNCVAIGLAANFIEPLEATSIWVSINMLQKILANPAWLHEDNQPIKDSFNKYVVEMNKDIADFVYFHYMGDRKDTKFWEKFSYESAPDLLKEKISNWQYRFPEKYDTGSFWSYSSWISVGFGVNKINKDISKHYLENLEKYKQILDNYNYHISFQDHKKFESISHNELLGLLK